MIGWHYAPDRRKFGTGFRMVIGKIAKNGCPTKSQNGTVPEIVYLRGFSGSDIFALK
jgi:hypothetical protein